MGFLKAALSHLLGGTAKGDRAEAVRLLSQVSRDALDLLLHVHAAFRAKNVREVNREVAAHPAEVRDLLSALTGPRQPGSSSGKFGDALNLTAWELELNEQGYSKQATALISRVFHRHVDGVLDELLASERSNPQTLPGQAMRSVTFGAVSEDQGDAGVDDGGDPEDDELEENDESDEAADWEEDKEPVPDWLEDLAWEAPVKIRNEMRLLGVRIVRRYPHVRSFSEWDDFERIATVAGCAAVALRLRVEVPRQFQEALHEEMLDRLVVIFPTVETPYKNCMSAAEKALLGAGLAKHSDATTRFVAEYVPQEPGQEGPR